MRNFDDSYGILSLNALNDQEDETDDAFDDPFIAWNKDFTEDFVAILKGIHQKHFRKKTVEGMGTRL